MNILITGAAGQLGRELQATAPAQYRLHALDRAALDITDELGVAKWVTRHKPALIINAAGFTAVDRAQSEPELAFRINVLGAIHLAHAAREQGARLIHVSTDYVFDGKSSTPYGRADAPRPLSVYGKTKLEGEQGVSVALGPKAVVLRTAWLYSAHGHNFVKTMLKLMSQREELRVVADQIGTPTWARGLAQAIWAAASRPELNGTYHWTDAGVASWYDFAVAIQEEAQRVGLLSSAVRIVPIRTEEYPTPAPRPAYSVLDKTDTWRDFGLHAEYWRVGLRGMLKELLV